MITAGDEFPLHQRAEPIAYAGSDRNFYDRYFFNGYHLTEEVFFAAALGVYPALNIMDAAFSVSIDGRQYNLRASKEMQFDRLDMCVAPMRLEIIEPLRHLRLTIVDNEHGLSGQLDAFARHAPIEEPRFTRRNGARVLLDYTRMTQNIEWEGEISLHGRAIEVRRAAFRGTRDRSWGIRPIGARDPQGDAPPQTPQFYWLWMPANFDALNLFCHSNDAGDGQAWNRRAVLATGDAVTHSDQLDLQTVYHPATRRVQSLTAQLGGLAAELHVEPCAPLFYMQGLGYTHPEWGHGMYRGAHAVAFDEIDLAGAEARLASGALEFLHVQSLARFTLRRGEKRDVGRGIVEQLLLGAHAPSGFSGLLDPIL